MASAKYYGTDGKEDNLGIPLFLFSCFRTTGCNLLVDEVSEVAVKCWPYKEDVPSFHYQVLTTKTAFVAQSCRKHGRFPHAVRELIRWIEQTVDQASVDLRTKLYPVLFAHGGDSKDFLFLFRCCAKFGIDVQSLTSLPIHFADPVPLLDLLKVRRHPLFSECKYLTLGSLLNDWYPGMFNPADLRSLPCRASLTTQLYTQTTLYPVLHKVPIYNIAEWNQYYEEAIKYKEDKCQLESHMPKHLKDVQAKFAVRAILRAGHNWTSLLELFQACTSPLQFRQELRDIDVKSSVARDISWMITDMKLEQYGTRPYVLKVKSHMPPQEYIGHQDPRGYYFVLRVANKFPTCFLTLADLEFSLRDHPIETPAGFSFSERLGQGAFSSSWTAGPFCYDVNGNEVLDLSLIDPDDYKEWMEEEEEDDNKQTDEDVEEYFQLQMQRAKEAESHKITSFVSGMKLNGNLLLTCMETDDEIPLPPEPSEEEKQRRSQLWESVRKQIAKDPTYQSSESAKLLKGNLTRATEDQKRHDKKGEKGKTRGSKKGASRGRMKHELEKWNQTRERNSDRINNVCSSTAEMFKVTEFDVKQGKESLQGAKCDVVRIGRPFQKSRFSMDEKTFKDSYGFETVRNSKPAYHEGSWPGQVNGITGVEEPGFRDCVIFVEHPSGMGIDIIYSQRESSKPEKSST
ncbi:hypothetical protein HOLleu_40545 [Holothuria leucospilota]|uniref:Uncharacterized protein n=1 Tax=Holothuria leucospilota TaxID=206669 RepID=A0A9Q0YFC3_HOLLE|nr:hypothetical protein HOLleu_40545 [Holothuria leucospilota]